MLETRGACDVHLYIERCTYERVSLSPKEAHSARGHIKHQFTCMQLTVSPPGTQGVMMQLITCNFSPTNERVINDIEEESAPPSNMGLKRSPSARSHLNEWGDATQELTRKIKSRRLCENQPNNQPSSKILPEQEKKVCTNCKWTFFISHAKNTDGRNDSQQFCSGDCLWSWHLSKSMTIDDID